MTSPPRPRFTRAARGGGPASQEMQHLARTCVRARARTRAIGVPGDPGPSRSEMFGGEGGMRKSAFALARVRACARARECAVRVLLGLQASPASLLSRGWASPCSPAWPWPIWSSRRTRWPAIRSSGSQPASCAAWTASTRTTFDRAAGAATVEECWSKQSTLLSVLGHAHEDGAVAAETKAQSRHRQVPPGPQPPPVEERV
jgi:hypothetical protein